MHCIFFQINFHSWWWREGGETGGGWEVCAGARSLLTNYHHNQTRTQREWVAPRPPLAVAPLCLFSHEPSSREDRPGSPRRWCSTSDRLPGCSAQPEPGRAAAASSSPARLSAPAAISKDKSTAADSDTAGGDRPRSSLCNSRGCSPKKERFAMPDLHGGGNLDKYESFRFLFLFFCSFKLESAWCGSSGDFALLQPLPEPPSWCLTVYKHPCWENKTFIAERGSSATIKKRLYWSPTALLLGGGNGVEKTKNNPSVLAVNQARKIEPKCKTNGLGN